MRHTAASRALEYVFEAEDLPDNLADDKVNAEIRVSIPRRTLILVAQPTSGTWTALTQTRDRIELSFDALFGADGDAIRGCATVHPLEVRRE